MSLCVCVCVCAEAVQQMLIPAVGELFVLADGRKMQEVGLKLEGPSQSLTGLQALLSTVRTKVASMLVKEVHGPKLLVATGSRLVTGSHAQRGRLGALSPDSTACTVHCTVHKAVRC